MTPNVKKYVRTCSRCNAEFRAAKPSARYCSDNCRKRACDDRHCASCIDCGGELGPRSGWGDRQERCRGCWVIRSFERTDQRATEFARLWNAGLKFAELQAHYGLSKGAISRMAFIYRQAGYDIPYRRTGQALENIRNANCRRATA